MKRIFFICSLLWCVGLPALAPSELETLIQKKDWPALARHFTDDTHQQLAAYFQECLGVGFSQLRPNDLMFFARFRDVAEIGEITFNPENGMVRQLSLKRNLTPLFFINSFNRYPVSDRTIRMGDAEIHFNKGVVFQGVPMEHLFVFCGDWEFRIRPTEEEERLTLIGLNRSDTFKREAQAGIFILSHGELVEGLPAPTPVGSLDDEEAKLLFGIFQKNWGMHVSFFNELWYFPFAADFNAAIFYHKPGKSYYRYVFNSALSPDTSLILFPENKFYLNYNAVKGLKLVVNAIDELENLKLNLFFNPQVHYLSGTAVLNFKEPSSMKMVNLDPGLVVRGYGKSPQHEIQLFNRGDNYYLLGQELDKFSFYYAGNIAAEEGAGELVKVKVKPPAVANTDEFFILNRDQNFYPNPGHHFFKSRVKISLPHPMLCLASGALSSQQRLGERNEFVFESPGSKGVSLVCGNFSKLETIPGKVPIQVFGNPKLRLREYFTSAEIRDFFDFLLERFGELDIREMNLLLRRHSDYGGLSYQGFAVLNLLDSAYVIDDISLARRIRRESPVVLTDVNRDGLVHELAHQWWGGVISWQSYQDQWLTEGLAQFSTLLYLQNSVSESRFRRAVAGAKKWVFRKSDAGPIVYGRRIANLSNDLETYQSIVYNKAALVFLMLKELLGEEELLQRLRRVLADFKYRSLATARFIQVLAQGDARLQKFFRGWVYSRKTPRVGYQVASAGPGAEITFTQKDTDFVFPVNVQIVTAEGKNIRTLIVEEKVQKFKIFENAPILSIEVEAVAAPIELER